MADKVCKECHRIISTGKICEICNSTSLSTDWSGYVIIIDPKNSNIAKKMGINLPGKYALKVR